MTWQRQSSGLAEIIQLLKDSQSAGANNEAHRHILQVRVKIIYWLLLFELIVFFFSA